MKVAIIGAGINGLYLAKNLSKKGHKTTVFEKRGVVGKVACSGLFSERLFSFFPESRQLIQNQINYGLVHFPKRIFKLKFSKKFFVMSHYDLDNLALEEARKSGTEVILNKMIGEQDFSFLQNNFDRIIGSDGPNSGVRKFIKLKYPDIKKRNFSVKLGIQGFIENRDNADFIETWPTKSGFLWKIPRGNKTEYGVFENPQNAKNILENFLKEKNILVKNFESAIIPQGLIIPASNIFTLCGDSAGLTKPWSGGGVIWGLLAADILLKNFPDFEKYKKETEKYFSPKIFLAKLITKTGYFLGNNAPWILPRERTIDNDFLL